MPLNRPSARRFRSALLGWTDRESGDELTVRVRGSERFLRDLEPLGFRGLDGDSQGAQQDPDAEPPAGSVPDPTAPGAGVPATRTLRPGERLSAVVSRTGPGSGKRFRSVLGRT
jgi:hypothetical protein